MRRTSTLVAAVTIVAFSTVRAQQFSLRLGGLSTHYADSLNAGAGSIATQLQWSGTRTQGTFEASWSRFNTGSNAGQVWGSIAAMGPRSRHAGLGVRADGVSNTITGSTWTATGTTELFGALLAHGWAFTAGISVGGVRDLNTARFATAGASARAWYEHADWIAGAAIATTSSTRAHFADVSTSADFRHGRVTIGVVASARRGDLSGPPWYQGRATVRVTPVLALEGAVGSYPRDLAGYDRGRYAHISLRIALFGARSGRDSGAAGLAARRSKVRVEPLDSAHTRVTFMLDGAGTPAIVGSWNAWTEMPLTETGGGQWSTVLPVGPGTWRFALVRNGRWEVPDGVTRLPDDFDGEVGILVVAGPTGG